MTDIETPHELHLVTDLPGSPDAVYDAWTQPEQFVTWWVAPGWTTHDVVLDVEPRGRFAAVQTSDDGEMEMEFAGFYREVEPGRRLVFTLSDGDTPDDDARTVMTVELEAGGSGTRQTFRQTGVITDEHYEALKAGTLQFFEQLESHLGERSVDAPTSA